MVLVFKIWVKYHLQPNRNWKNVNEGPEVRGTRPVLVTFENFKDRDEVLRKVSAKNYLKRVSTMYLNDWFCPHGHSPVKYRIKCRLGCWRRRMSTSRKTWASGLEKTGQSSGSSWDRCALVCACMHLCTCVLPIMCRKINLDFQWIYPYLNMAGEEGKSREELLPSVRQTIHW